MDVARFLPPLHGEAGLRSRPGGGGPESPTPSSLRADVPPHEGEGDRNRLRQTAQAFEASFLAQMLKPMFETLSTDGLFGGGQAEETWRGFQVEAMARQIARAGGVGLADQVLAEMIRMQEARP